MALGTAAVGTVAAGFIGTCVLLSPKYLGASKGAEPDMPPGWFAGWLRTDDLTGPRSPDEILDALRSAAPEFGSANWVVGSGGPAPAEFIEFRVTVKADGKVRQAQGVAGLADAEHGVVFFLSKTLALKTKFPPADGETQFTVRFVFEPR